MTSFVKGIRPIRVYSCMFHYRMNISLLSTGRKGTFHVYLIDMGLARLKTTTCTMTNVGNAAGTPYYCSPESFYGNICVASDVWSYGLVLSEVFGRKPAWGKLLTQAEMAQLIVAKKVQHLNPNIRRVCEGCLQYDAKKETQHDECDTTTAVNKDLTT